MAPFAPVSVAEWQKTFEEKLTPLFSARESLSDEEALKMGKKDAEQEVEKFVTLNTQELGKDKWQCPLSGKKFKVRLFCPLPPPGAWPAGPAPDPLSPTRAPSSCASTSSTSMRRRSRR